LAELYYVDANFYMWRRHAVGLTGSPARLTTYALDAYRELRRDPLLRDYRRESRWAYYNAAKGLALNNLLSGYRMRALRFAIEAFVADPREIAEFGRFLALMRLRNANDIATRGAMYSRAERFVFRR
jgi:hypothetical protein